jgi:hypothetical protein
MATELAEVARSLLTRSHLKSSKDRSVGPKLAMALWTRLFEPEDGFAKRAIEFPVDPARMTDSLC